VTWWTLLRKIPVGAFGENSGRLLQPSGPKIDFISSLKFLHWSSDLVDLAQKNSFRDLWVKIWEVAATFWPQAVFFKFFKIPALVQ